MNPRAPRLLLRLLLLLVCTSTAAADVLVPAGSVWRYRANGSNQGTAWRGTSFNDTAWSSGPAELGYGDGDEATVVPYGPLESAKYITTYFRHTFNVTDPGAYTSVLLSTLRDDGAVVYLNNVEVWRSENMPSGTINYLTPASWALGTPEEATFYDAQVPASLLVAGTNVLAVEVHQADATSTDVSFDLRLEGLTTYTVTRGPYLQRGTPTSMVVRWRTNGATDSRVRYGTSPGNLNQVIDDATSTTEHQVTLTGLTPYTTYYYSVGSTTQTLAGDATHTFLTSPAPGTPVPTRIWILGDSGAANHEARAVRDAYLSYPGSDDTNLWLMLGDNAYEEGTDAEYQAAVFDMHPEMLRRSVLWPTIGNHDTAHSTAPPPTLPYFAMFTLPTAGEAGGVASGTERYYSFDYGSIHFICLDSMTSDRSTTGAMMTWLENDLAATTRPWIIAFWHHPPYSKGSHDSDYEDELLEMRQNALPILESYGVDLVLSGHSHAYERSYLIDGHYGTSETFTSAMKKDGGSGRPEETGAYEKATTGMGPHEGAVYAVAGSGSITSGGELDHPAMFISMNQLGSMVLDVDGNRLDAKFLRENGVVADSFTILKGPAAEPPTAPSALSASAVSTTRIDLTWTDNATNEEHFTLERCTGSAAMCDATPSLFAQIAQPASNATTYSDTTLSPNTTYSYRIRAENTHGNSAWSNTATATTNACSYIVAPDAFAAFPSAGASDSVTITTDAVCPWEATTSTPWITIDSGASGSGNGTTTFTVAANVGAARSGSMTVAGTVISIAQESAPPPDAPSAVNATPSSTSAIDVTWSDDSTTEERFTLERCTGSASTCAATPALFAQIAQPAANVTSYPDSGLAPNTTYSYRVRAESTLGNSAWSNIATATTSACAFIVTPTSFTIGASGGSEDVTITTDAACAWESSSAAAWITITAGASGSGNGTTTFAVAANGGAARNATISVAGTSISISQAATPAPATPTGVSAEAIAGNTIRVTWTAVANASSYQILRASAGSPLSVIGTSPIAQYDDAVTPNTAYRYAVRAMNAGGTSLESASDLATSIVFTDAPLAPNTPVRLAHLTERRNAVNAVRALAGLSAYAFTSSPLIRAAHVNELRAALDQALSILGLPTGGYTGTPAVGGVIRAVHFREIAERVQ